MRTNVVIDDALMEEARRASGLKTKKETIEAALRLIIAMGRQVEIRKLRGKLQWEGDLEAMRQDT